MNKRKRIILCLVILLLLLPAIGFFLRRSVASWRWSQAVSAAGAMPYQIGLTNTQMVKCTVSCNGGCCIGSGIRGELCSAKAPGICASYSEISGTMAGGSGDSALFSNITQIPMSGYKPGDSIIAGGMTMTEMDSGVLASPGGCAGCTAKAGMVERIFSLIEKFDKYIIAGMKGSKK